MFGTKPLVSPCILMLAQKAPTTSCLSVTSQHMLAYEEFLEEIVFAYY